MPSDKYAYEIVILSRIPGTYNANAVILAQSLLQLAFRGDKMAQRKARDDATTTLKQESKAIGATFNKDRQKAKGKLSGQLKKQGMVNAADREKYYKETGLPTFKHQKYDPIIERFEKS